MTKRTYNRRTDTELIDELQDRIKMIESRVQARKRQDSPVLKEIPKVKRSLAKFAQICTDHHRGDLSNTVLAFLATIERQARHAPEHVMRSGSRGEEQTA
ncbi:MAG: hypothetical protein ACI8QZ_001003 [Chlamydiales bacterium]|jgi:hypothetical protein